MAYTTTETSLEELFTALLEGYNYTAVYRHKDFITRDKKRANFVGTQLITFDVDNAQPYVSLSDFCKSCAYLPTIAYTTPSHLHEDGQGTHARFRLIYVCNALITNENTYHEIYENIKEGLPFELLDSTKKDDKCGQYITQQFGGNAQASETLFNPSNIVTIDQHKEESNGLVSLSDAPTYIAQAQAPRQAPNLPRVSKESLSFAKSILIKRKREITDFYQDLNTLQPTDLIIKYSQVFEHIEATKIDFDGKPYAEVKEDYNEIIRYYQVYTDARGQKRSKAVRLQDGQKRRYTMFVHTALRKQIKPTATREELIYNLVLDRLYYYDNSDKVLDNKTLVNIVSCVLKKKYAITSKKPKYKINKEFCKMNGISTKKMVQQARKELNHSKIGEFYDTSKSVKENLQALHDLGVKVCLATLYTFCKENAIPTKGIANESAKPKQVEQATEQAKTIERATATPKHVERTHTHERPYLKIGNYTTTWKDILTQEKLPSLLCFRQVPTEQPKRLQDTKYNELAKSLVRAHRYTRTQVITKSNS